VQPSFRQEDQIVHRRERCPQRSEKQGNPKGNFHFDKEAELPTVGNAVLSVPKKRTVGDDGPYRKPTLCKKGKIAHRRERCPQRSEKQGNPAGSLPRGEGGPPLAAVKEG